MTEVPSTLESLNLGALINGLPDEQRIPLVAALHTCDIDNIVSTLRAMLPLAPKMALDLAYRSVTPAQKAELNRQMREARGVHATD